MAAPMNLLANQFSRLALHAGCVARTTRCLHTQAGPLCFQATQQLRAEPMKRRKGPDLQLVILKENKKKRRLEKEIRRLEKRGRVLKPVDEIEGDRSLMKAYIREERKRERPTLSFEESESRAKLHREWQRYRLHEHISETRIIKRAYDEQQRALQELKAENEDLYKMAVQLDDNLVLSEVKGPVRTPPIKDYYLDGPDGHITNVTQRFDK